MADQTEDLAIERTLDINKLKRGYLDTQSDSCLFNTVEIPLKRLTNAIELDNVDSEDEERDNDESPQANRNNQKLDIDLSNFSQTQEDNQIVGGNKHNSDDSEKESYCDRISLPASEDASKTWSGIKVIDTGNTKHPGTPSDIQNVNHFALPSVSQFNIYTQPTTPSPHIGFRSHQAKNIYVSVADSQERRQRLQREHSTNGDSLDFFDKEFSAELERGKVNTGEILERLRFTRVANFDSTAEIQVIDARADSEKISTSHVQWPDRKDDVFLPSEPSSTNYDENEDHSNNTVVVNSTDPDATTPLTKNGTPVPALAAELQVPRTVQKSHEKRDTLSQRMVSVSSPSDNTQESRDSIALMPTQIIGRPSDNSRLLAEDSQPTSQLINISSPYGSVLRQGTLLQEQSIARVTLYNEAQKDHRRQVGGPVTQVPSSPLDLIENLSSDPISTISSPKAQSRDRYNTLIGESGRKRRKSEPVQIREEHFSQRRCPGRHTLSMIESSDENDSQTSNCVGREKTKQLGAGSSGPVDANDRLIESPIELRPRKRGLCSKGLTEDNSEIVAPQRIFANWNGPRSGYYPSTLLSRGSQARKMEVMFDDGSRVWVDAIHVRSLDLRPGDHVRVDEKGMRNFTYEIVRMECRSLQSGHTCIRGNDTLILRQHRASGAISDIITESEYIEIPVDSIYVVSGMWKQFISRAIPATVAACLPALRWDKIKVIDDWQNYGKVITDGLSTNVADQETKETLHQQESRQRIRTPTIQSPAKQLSPRILLDNGNGVEPSDGIHESNASGIFSGFAFAITGCEESERKALRGRILSNGGIYLENGLEDLFGFRDNRMMPRHSLMRRIRFAAVLSDGLSRKVKYLQGIALGWPCLSIEFVVRSCERGFIEPWKPYLMPAGEMTITAGNFYSKLAYVNIFEVGLDRQWSILEHYYHRMKYLLGRRIVLMESKRTIGLATLLSMMGPDVLGITSSLKGLQTLLSAGCAKQNVPGCFILSLSERDFDTDTSEYQAWDFVYVEDDNMKGPVSLITPNSVTIVNRDWILSHLTSCEGIRL
ncbi:hypothetical protein V1511DRAFT_490673 [Dipodascopsis uninucleata]